MQLKNQLLGLTLSLLTIGCVDFNSLGDAKLPDYQAEFAVPLVNSRLTIADILDVNQTIGSLEVGADNTLQLIYRGDVLKRQSNEILEQFQSSFPPFIPVFSKDLRLPLNLLNGLELDQLIFKAGGFTYYLENENDQGLQIDFEFSSLIHEDGTPLQFSLNLDAYTGTGAKPFATNQSEPIDLTAYRLVPEDNEIVLKYSAQSSEGEALNASNFVIGLNDLDFSYIEGYLGQLEIPGGRDTVNIDFFENYTNGEIYFDEPQVSFFIDNSFGVPTRALVKEFFVETLSGAQLPVMSPLIDAGVDFPFPTLDQIGQIAKGEVLVNNSNSNIDTLLSANPIRVIYDVDALINPEADSDIAGFVTDSSFFDVQMEVRLPLLGRAEGFRATDTLSFDLGNTGNINSAEFKIITENELGVDVGLQVYFLDDQKNPIDSLFLENSAIIKGATVDDSGVPIASESVTTFVDFDQSRVEKVEDAPFMVLEARFSTETNAQQSVRIQNTQGVTIRIGAILGLSND
ncbi:MAG: hypothetical protein Sapg2KO_22080 [Saprospiraceae bacterium]